MQVKLKHKIQSIVILFFKIQLIYHIKMEGRWIFMQTHKALIDDPLRVSKVSFLKILRYNYL